MESTEQEIVVRRLEEKGYLVIPVPNQLSKGKPKPGEITSSAPDLLIIRALLYPRKPHPTAGGMWYVWRGEDEWDIETYKLQFQGYTQASFPSKALLRGVALEMKDRTTPGVAHRVSAREHRQRGMLQRFRKEDWFGFVAHGADEALEVLHHIYGEEF